MKYTLAAIVLLVIALLTWGLAVGEGADVAMMSLAIVSVIFFSALPVLLGITTRKKQVRDSGSVTVVKMPTAPSVTDPPEPGSRDRA